MTFPIQIEGCVELKELLNQFEQHPLVKATELLPSDAGSDAFIKLVLLYWKREPRGFRRSKANVHFYTEALRLFLFSEKPDLINCITEELSSDDLLKILLFNENENEGAKRSSFMLLSELYEIFHDNTNLLMPKNRAPLGEKPYTLFFLAHALCNLRCDNLLEDNRAAIIAHAAPDDLARGLSELQKANLLTTENTAALIAHANPWDLARVFCRLQKVNLLIPENVASLSNNNFLCTQRCFKIVWQDIPDHLLTQAVFDQLIAVAQATNAQQQIMRYVEQLLGINRDAPAINHDQSTHTASVHQSVSISATKLFNLYGQSIEGAFLNNTLQRISIYINALPDNSERNEAAKRCIRRITIPSHSFTDPGSQLTTQQLLALTFLALNDGGNRKGTLADAREQFVEGLYEIQRGYNLSDTGVDRGGPDKPICESGTFNKLIEKLEGIHPEVKVLHITPANASRKLPIIIREVTIDYLASLSKPQTAEGLHRFAQLIGQINKDECIDVIWDHIKDKIADRLFDEFASIYEGKTDPKFINLVDAGQYVKLQDLSCFQKQILVSPGYIQYCSQILRNNSMSFFSVNNTDYLSSHRHDNPTAQQEYDKHFSPPPNPK